jgi:DNA mismatch repair protein MutS
VERALGEQFVPNDVLLDASRQLLLLTGPNMAGKSTYLRQVATLVLLAQCGCPVPAQAMRWSPVDRIFTRVGAQDDLGGGLSTFMVEMLEVAHILHSATPHSLVILDEVGRGTSTYDGLSIARAVVEHLHDDPRLRPLTLFATHFQELAGLAGRLERLAVARMRVIEEEGQVTFLHQVEPGAADRSYGIHVAELAGVPGSVVARAREVLRDLEGRRQPASEPEPSPAAAPYAQLDFGLVLSHPVLLELEQLDLLKLSPLEALQALHELQERLRQPGET